MRVLFLHLDNGCVIVAYSGSASTQERMVSQGLETHKMC